MKLFGLFEKKYVRKSGTYFVDHVLGGIRVYKKKLFLYVYVHTYEPPQTNALHTPENWAKFAISEYEDENDLYRELM